MFDYSAADETEALIELGLNVEMPIDFKVDGASRNDPWGNVREKPKASTSR